MWNLLLEAGADVNIVDNARKSALSYAAAKGNTEHSTLLLEAGAHVNSINKEGDTALTSAIINNHFSVANVLIKSGADVDHLNPVDGNSVLQTAILLKKTPFVDLMLAAGADVNATNKLDGSTALHCAARTGQNTVIKTLITAGADVNIKDNNGNTAFHALTSAKNIFTTELCMTLLLNAGAFINIPNNQGFNPLKCYITKLERISNKLALLMYAAGEKLDDTKMEIQSPHGDCMIEIPTCLKHSKRDLNLMCICRRAIRGHLLNVNPHLPLFNRVRQLGLPPTLSAYLLFGMSLGKLY